MEIKITDNSDKVREELEEAVERALLTCGIEAQGKARDLCPYVTGLLRNSIAYALGGEEAVPSTYKADKSDDSGSYSGTAPADDKGKRTVWLGTNVEYAQKVETGTGQKKAEPFIAPAVSDYASKYESIIKKELGG